jgi:hypothetical protein
VWAAKPSSFGTGAAPIAARYLPYRTRGVMLRSALQTKDRVSANKHNCQGSNASGGI